MGRPQPRGISFSAPSAPLPQLTFDDPPGVQSSPDPLPLRLHHSVAADNSEGRTFLGKGSKDPAQPGIVRTLAQRLRGSGHRHCHHLPPNPHSSSSGASTAL